MLKEAGAVVICGMKTELRLVPNENSETIGGQSCADGAKALFRSHLEQGYRETNRFFSGLLLLECLVLIVVGFLVAHADVHRPLGAENWHTWGPVVFGIVVSFGAIALTRLWPGAIVTRFAIAAAQMLHSELLVMLSGGRWGTHFHVFCSLIILSLYRDWRVFAPATLVVVTDHFLAGTFWPGLPGAAVANSGWQSLPHFTWVLIADIILAISCVRAVREMRARANRAAASESSERSFRQIFEEVPIGMAVVGMDERYREANTTFRRMLGLTPNELIGRTPFDFTHPDDMEATRQTMRILLHSRESHRIEKRYLRKDGGILWAKRTSCLMRDHTGRPLHFLTTVEDITEWKSAQEALHKQAERLAASQHANQLIMDNSRDVICSLDSQGRFLSISAACERLWGYNAEQLIGRCYLVLVHPEDRAPSKAMEESTRSGAKVTDFVNRCVRPDGRIVDVLWSASWSEAEEMLFCVARDVTEQQRIERELRDAKDAADRANRAKSEFLSRMSHELRTPLNAILGFGQLLEHRDPRPAQRPHLHYILSAGHHLLELIDEVLDISRIEADRMRLSLEPVSVEAAVKEAIELIKPLANEHRVHLFTPPEEDLTAFVLADHQRLKQVLLNLLNNGVKYTAENGAVMVQCTCEDERVRITIHDTGMGIAPEKLERVFTPFDRLGAEQSRVEGTGLGLALSQRLIHAMRGRIGVESKVGEGSSFWFEVARTESPLRTVAPDSDPPTGARLQGALKRRSILYIEDNLSNLNLVEQLLREEPGVELLIAMQGRLGLDLARQRSPDLILLDLHLPDMPGADVLADLQANEATRRIPTVVVSADATAGEFQRVMEAGARDYITKPIDVSHFYRVVEQNTGNRGECAPA